VPQLKMSKNNGQDSTSYVPKTDEERNEAFGLLDELLKELGREEALRRELARSLLKLPLEELEPEELRKELRRAARRDERLVQQPPQDDLSSGQP
jgi:hypothetical protein